MKALLVAAALVATVIVTAGGGAISAHHSFAAEYDANQPITLAGQIARIEFVSPHSWLYLDVKGSRGAVVQWRVEMAPPNNLLRRGVTQATFHVGERVRVDGYRARNGGSIVSGRQLRTADGRTLFTGPSATGPPDH